PLTPDYASPEQLAGGAVTTASDVYSLGVVVHQLLTGEKPGAHGRGGDPIRPSEAVTSRQAGPDQSSAQRCGMDAKRLAAALKGDLDTIVLHAVRHAALDRYQTPGEFARDIERHLRD